MPAIANIVVKKNDGTTDITYTAVVPSSGDGSNAIWKSQSVGTSPAHQPEFRLSSREASNGAKRALRATFIYPQIATDTTTSVTSVIDRVVISADWTMPKGMSQTDLNEAASQLGNLLAATLVKDSVKTGYAPT